MLPAPPQSAKRRPRTFANTASFPRRERRDARRQTRDAIATALAAAALLAACARDLPAPQTLILATTTSVMDSGLLEPLVERFERESGVAVKPIVVGSGAALEMARRGDVDAVLVHSPEDEARYVASGDLVDRRYVMRNDFVIVGPRGDPAGARGAQTAPQAMARIAARGTFVARGDGSGTDRVEQRLWREARIDPRGLARRIETGSGMGATLNVANERGAYTLSDRGTFVSLRARLRIVLLFPPDSSLQNVYHAYRVNPAKHARVNEAPASRFVDFLEGPSAQRLIADYGRAEYGEPLFRPARPVR